MAVFKSIIRSLRILKLSIPITNNGPEFEDSDTSIIGYNWEM